jgi:hypothetical protein
MTPARFDIFRRGDRAARVGALVASFLMYLCCGVIAGEIDFSTLLKDLDGKPLPLSAEKNAQPLTLRDVVVNSLIAPKQANAGSAAPERKVKEFVLATRVANAKTPLTLTSEDITLIKEDVSAVYPSPLIIGRVLEAIDPAALNVK